MIRNYVSATLTTARDDMYATAEYKSVNTGALLEKKILTSVPITSLGTTVFPAPNANILRIMPVCSLAQINTMRVFGWNKAIVSATETIWIPSLLYSTTVTFGGSAVSRSQAPTTIFCPTTFTTLYGTAIQYTGSANFHPGHLVIDALGAQIIEVDMTGTASSFNVFVGGI